VQYIPHKKLGLATAQVTTPSGQSNRGGRQLHGSDAAKGYWTSSQSNFIINMDQTPVYFSMMPSSTLDLVGCKTVHVRKSTTGTK
jgi:hypothetical protein